MKKVACFIARKEQELWHDVIAGVESAGIKVHRKAVECETALVLDGRWINILAIPCKERVLIFHENIWVPPIEFYKPVLEIYFQKFINTTTLSKEDTIKTIIDYVNNLENQLHKEE